MAHPHKSSYWKIWMTCGPGLLWELVFLVIPFFGIVLISFLSRGELGDIQLPFTIENYARLFGKGFLGFDPMYLWILGHSVLLSLLTTALCLATGLPLAFFIAQLNERVRHFALMLVVAPLWTNLLIRTYAWQIILAPEGLVTRLVSWLGIINPQDAFYPGIFAVYIGMVCDYLPFLVLPLYVSVEKIDYHLIDAARDLGANPLQVLRHAIFPQIAPGLFAGIILVFIPALGQFIIPDLLGGAKIMLLGNALQMEFGASRDWPFGSAIAVVTLALVSAGLFLYAKLQRNSEQNRSL